MSERLALEMTGIYKSFSKAQAMVHALSGVCLRVNRGDFVIVRGPSGSGKTTLLLTAGGLLAPDEGRVAVAGCDLYAKTSEERARMRAVSIGFVFQQFHLLPYLTTLENTLVPSLALGRAEGKVRARARALLADFQLSHRLAYLPGELSTGERQRTALARALLNNPEVLLVDEPTGNLDPENAMIVMDRMAAYVRSGGTVLMVTHSVVAANYAHRIVILEGGVLNRDDGLSDVEPVSKDR